MQRVEVWKFNSYQEFIRAYLKTLPKSGRGASLKIAQTIGVHTTLFSQIIRGHRELTMEQAAALCDYLGFSDEESELFLNYVSLQRAGTESLKNKIKKRILEKKEKFQEVSSRIKASHVLTEKDKSVFYSSWQYSAVRMYISLEGRPITQEEASSKLNIPLARVREIIDFLVQTGLIISERGKLRIGPASTHIDGKSIWATRHHSNWRIQHLSKLEEVTAKELCFTAPFSCSSKDQKKIKEILLSAIEEVSAIVKDSPAEEVHTICIDLMHLI